PNDSVRIPRPRAIWCPGNIASRQSPAYSLAHRGVRTRGQEAELDRGGGKLALNGRTPACAGAATCRFAALVLAPLAAWAVSAGARAQEYGTSSGQPLSDLTLG